MDKIYRIGSFNLHNIGISAFTNSRNLEKIAEIIRTFDVVALQEVLSEGKIFTSEDFPSNIAKRNILSYLGGSKHWGFSWAYSGDESNRHEGYAFVWNKDRLDLPEIEAIKNGRKYNRKFYPQMIKLNHTDMKRQPYFARFSAVGKTGGSSFEIRLLCVHTYFGADKFNDRKIRQQELDILLKDIYPQIEDRCYKGGLINYTVLLGDYNAELVTTKNRVGHEQLNSYRNAHGIRLPMVMETDSEGFVHSDQYGVDIKTVQDELTTLKKRYDELNDQEEFADRGFASSYDHFSYDEKRIGDVIYKNPKRIDAVRQYCNDDFEEYYKTISDHIPIVMELKIN